MVVRRWDVQYGLLGPIEARYGGRLIPIAAGQARAVLATLLLRNGKVVPTEVLIERMWGTDPPKSARTIVQSYVSKLRKTLDSGGAGAGPRLITQYPGYLMDVDASQLDLHRFHSMAERGRLARDRGQLAEASVALRAALDLWRGPALSDVESEALHQIDVPRLEESRLNTVEDWVDVELALGRHREIMNSIQSEATGLRQRLFGQLMIALYRSGRQIEALRAFRLIRRRLVNDLGLEPGAELQSIHQAVLRGDTSLDWQPPPAVTVTVTEAETAAGPMQLPAGHRYFVGREQTVARISAMLCNDQSRDYVPAVAVTGPAGIGKSALALHVAHQLRDEYAGGRLYVDLRGSRSDRMGTAQALAELMRPLLPADAQSADDLDSRLRAYQARLMDLRAMIVLDDAADEAHIRPLLPIYAGCAVIVTSRSPLTGLVEANPLPLPAMTAGESRLLLREMIGAARIEAEPDAVDAVLSRCEGLPVAVRIAAARLQERPHWPIGMLADRLLEEPLAELSIGDLSVRSCLAESYQSLEDAERRCLQLLALAPDDEISLKAAVRMVGESVHEVINHLDRLVETRFVSVSVYGSTINYQLGGLARAFATECIVAESATDMQLAGHLVATLR